jgi:hypothetical protein
MGQVLHSRATTTETVRRAIQSSQASLRTLAKGLESLGGLTPYEYICQQWQKQPDLFLHNPFHHTLGL